MNRTVALPALFSLIAFGAFYAGRLGSSGHGISLNAASIDANQPTIDFDEAAGLVRALADQFQARYSSFDSAQHEFLSRALIRREPRPKIQLDITMSPRWPQQQSRLAAAKISIHWPHDTIVLPCVVDLATREILVFQHNRWLMAQDWLSTATTYQYGALLPKKAG